MRAKKTMFRPVVPKRTFEDISEQIQNLIYSKALKPNDKLPSERDLAKQFNTGRMSVREALRKLEESGLVTIKQGVDGGTVIRDLDSTGITKSISSLMNVGKLTLQEIKEARIAVESMVLESSIKHFTEKQLAALETNIKTCEQFFQKRKKNAYPNFSDKELGQFHILIAKTSKNRLFTYFITSLLYLYVNQIIKYIPDQKEYSKHLKHHKEILDAIKAKDLERAKKALEYHIQSSTKYVERTVNESTGKA
jgi:DNA-binding FadR family transcriptional regulator